MAASGFSTRRGAETAAMGVTSSSRDAAGMMRTVKRQVDMERQMDVDRASEKRKDAEREANQEAQQIVVRPRHSAPRNAAPRCVDWNPRRR